MRSKQKPITTKCKGCGKEFTYVSKNRYKRRSFCSQKCARKNWNT